MQKESINGRDVVADLFWKNREVISPRTGGFGLENVSGFVDTGTDSIVVRQDDRVIKLFNFREPGLRFGLTLKQLLFYQEITNRAGIYLEGNPRSLYAKNRGSLARIRVLPIDEVGYSRYLQTPFTVSQFVPGDNFLYGWALEYPKQNGYSDDEVMGKMRQVGREISDQFGVRGISIARVNFKIVTKPQQEDEIVITDLCSHIQDLGLE